MAKEDWVSCKVHYKMVESIDRFLKTETAKKNGILSRSDFLTAVLRKFFSQYEGEYGVFVTRDSVRNTKEEDVPKPFDLVESSAHSFASVVPAILPSALAQGFGVFALGGFPGLL